ncbi:UDP-N-acetylmuramoyl-L-alanine--D-glutamate ligase, partial [Candidatus Saccharibacteria bacterium]|nr:UDP-N-acetylmuramoyl-L-alanine--D-glutamate ligase [Candidatus Saccharibacteria bacterium]
LLPTGAVLESLADKSVVFVGIGQGRALAGVEEYIRSRVSIQSFVAVDRQTPDTSLNFLTEYDPANTIFIKNEGIPGHQMPVPYITTMQIFFDEVRLRGNTTIGITGTKGKSTTASLVHHILKNNDKETALLGNIGQSALASLQSSTLNTVFVVELSSYQLSDLRISPDISVCTNLFNDHANWHGSTDQYWNDKMNIIKYAASDDHFVYDANCAPLREWASQTKATTHPIDHSKLPDLDDSKLFGTHNQINALLAITAVEILGINQHQSLEALRSFEPLRHRMQYIGTKNDIIFVDDAIGMTPESTIASIKAVSQKYGPIGCIMLGGQDRGYDFNNLIDTVYQHNIPNIVLFPDTSETLKALIARHSDYRPQILESRDMQESVAFAYQHAPKKQVILLSTGAPSYSVWRDFEQKGDLFQQAYTEL